MKAGSYLSAARVYSLVMLATLYLDVDLVIGQAKLNSWLHGAREIWAVYYLQTRPPGTEEIAEDPVAGIGSVTVRRQTPAGTIRLLDVLRSDGRRWHLVVDASAARNAVPEQLIERLKRVALDVGVKDAESASATALLREIERTVAGRKVPVLGTDLAFRADVAPWIVASLVVVLLLLIRNDLRWTLLDEDGGIDEPWIILDGEAGLEKLVAFGWGATILAAPWVASGCLMASLSSQIIVDGSIDSWPREVLTGLTALSLLLIGGWTSATVAGQLVALRRVRLARWHRPGVAPPAGP